MRTVEDWLVEAFQARERDLPEWALRAFGEALQLDPTDDAIRLEIARSQIHLALQGEARETLTALTLVPAEDGEFLVEVAGVHILAGQVEEALACLRRVMPRDPCFSGAVIETIRLLERAGRMEEAERELRGRGDASGTRAFAEALLAEQAGAEEEAIGLLQRALPPVPQAGLVLDFAYRLARLLDRHGRGQEAIQLLRKWKAFERATMTSGVLASFVSDRRAHDRQVLEVLPKDWFDERADVGGADAVLVLGHPRTGSSMTSKKLTAATGARWVDESPAFEVLARERLRLSGVGARAAGFFEFLSAMDDGAALRFQQEYRSRLGYGGKGRLIDKNPGLGTSYPALAKLLPGSAWLVMQRDPRDVALSCYFQRLGATPLGWSSLTLEGALEAVWHTLGYWQAIRDQLRPAQYLEVRYEAMVARPGETLSTIVSRLGWEDGQGSEGEPAALNLSPSYADIRRPTYASAVSRWLGHREWFPVLSAAQERMLERDGYSRDGS